MIAPVGLSALIDATRIAVARDAARDALGRLLVGVTVKAHPGKVDVEDYVKKAIVSAPGVALGYTRVRELADPGGTFGLAVDFAAYIVVEDYADTVTLRGVDREVVGHAIGLQILRILRDPDTASWGLGAIEPPAMDPPPEFVPIFSMRTAENATALYAVRWTQTLVQEGEPFFDGPTPALHGLRGPDDAAAGVPAAGDGDDELAFDLPPGAEDDYPPEVLAYMRRGGPLPGEG